MKKLLTLTLVSLLVTLFASAQVYDYPNCEPLFNSRKGKKFMALTPEGKEAFTVSLPTSGKSAFYQFRQGLAELYAGGGVHYFIKPNGDSAFSIKNKYAFGFFADGLSRFYDNKSGKTGYIGMDGKVAIEAEYTGGYTFNNGFTVVYNGITKKDYHYFVINTKGEKVNPDKPFTDFRDFHEGYVLSGNKLYNYLGDERKDLNDKVEAYRVANNYTIAHIQSVPYEGVFAVRYFNSLGIGKVGYMDTKGNMVITPQFNYSGNFVNGYTWVTNEQGLYGFINKEGKLIAPYRYKFVHPFDNGLAAVSVDGKKWGAINEIGQEVIGLVFDDLEPFSYGVAPARIGKLWGLVDTKGQWIVQPTYDHIDKALSNIDCGCDDFYKVTSW